MPQFEQTYENKNFTPEAGDTGDSQEREAKVGRIREYLGNVALVAASVTTGSVMGHELMHRFADIDPSTHTGVAIPVALTAYYAAYLAKKKL